jgi:hypothetical protein
MFPVVRFYFLARGLISLSLATISLMASIAASASPI